MYSQTYTEIGDLVIDEIANIGYSALMKYPEGDKKVLCFASHLYTLITFIKVLFGSVEEKLEKSSHFLKSNFSIFYAFFVI